MSQRLIDSDALKAFIKNLEVTNGPGRLVPGVVYAMEVMFPKLIEGQPSIDPEALPIVRELRKQLEHKDHLLRIAQREIKECEPVHAHWEVSPLYPAAGKRYRCSHCKEDNMHITDYLLEQGRADKFCKNCGAIMDEEVEGNA